MSSLKAFICVTNMIRVVTSLHWNDMMVRFKKNEPSRSSFDNLYGIPDNATDQNDHIFIITILSI